MAEFSNSQHFENKDPAVKSIYDLILKESRKFGTVMEEPKKTSIHLVNKSAAPIRHVRIAKSGKLSASRFHHEVKLTSTDEVDCVLNGWLKEAYAISG